MKKHNTYTLLFCGLFAMASIPLAIIIGYGRSNQSYYLSGGGTSKIYFVNGVVVIPTDNEENRSLIEKSYELHDPIGTVDIVWTDETTRYPQLPKHILTMLSPQITIEKSAKTTITNDQVRDALMKSLCLQPELSRFAELVSSNGGTTEKILWKSMIHKGIGLGSLIGISLSIIVLMLRSDALSHYKYRYRIAKGICPICKYPILAEVKMCPECGVDIEALGKRINKQE